MSTDPFDQIWSDTLEPRLLSLEGERQAAVRVLWIRIVALGLLGLLVTAIFLIFGAVDFPWFLPPGIAIAIGAGWGMVPLTTLRKRVKSEINTTVTDVFGLSYSVTSHAPGFNTFETLGLLPHHDRSSFEDHIAGPVDGSQMELYEAHLEERRRSKNRTYYVTVFRGVLIRIQFPRKVEGTTVITRDRGWFNGLTAMGKKWGSKKLERIGLVDPTFEKIFEVYGDDQVLARYMLTPSFMERLMDLEKALHGKQVRAAFLPGEAGQGGELILAAETGNQFEVGSMFQPLASKTRVETVVRELAALRRVIAFLIKPASESGEFADRGER